MRKLGIAALVIAVGIMLGATVFREQAAWAAQIVDARITNLDASGNIKMHEQGTATVTGTVAAKPIAPETPLVAWANTDSDQTGYLLGPSTQPINLTALVVTATAPVLTGSHDDVALTAWDVPSSQTTCGDSPLAKEGIVWRIVLFADQPELAMSFPTPLVVMPAAGRKECLGFFVIGNAYFGLDVSASGFYG